MKKNRILLVSPYSAEKVGGIGTWSKNVIDYAKKDNIDLVFLNTAFSFKPNIVKSKISRVSWGIVDTFVILSKLLVYIVYKRPSIIHYTSSASLALPKDLLAILISKLFSVKFIIHFRFGRIPELAKSKNMEWRMLSKVIKSASINIVIDKKSFDTLKRENFSNIVLIPNVISDELEDLGKFNSNHGKQIKEGKVVFVGHVIIAKGIYELVEACRNCKEVKELHILGPYTEEVKTNLIEMASIRDDSNWLIFHGERKREDVIEALKDANLLCLPSYTEGFPNVVLEAMASACPVVATNVGAIEEMIDSDSNSPGGICVDPKDVNQLEEALFRVLNDTPFARQLGQNGLNKVLNNYSRVRVMSKLKELWQY